MNKIDKILKTVIRTLLLLLVITCVVYTGHEWYTYGSLDAIPKTTSLHETAIVIGLIGIVTGGLSLLFMLLWYTIDGN